MDKAEVRMILESYRPGDVDADDPIFHEALAAVKNDPELAQWFQAKQRFDALMMQRFDEMLPVVDGVKHQILLGAQSRLDAGAQKKIISWKWPLAVAALLMLGALGWRLADLRRTPGERLGLQAINYSAEMPALQFVCFDAGVVADWVQKQPFAQRAGIQLAKSPGNMRMIGSSVGNWNGKPVAMICLQNGERMAMLYLLSGDDFPLQTTGEVVQKAGWTSRTGKVGKNTWVLTGKGNAADLNYDLPF